MVLMIGSLLIDEDELLVDASTVLDIMVQSLKLDLHS